MSIRYDVLGDAGRDNALLVRVDSGQAFERLLFDCGDGCLDGLSIAEIQALDGVCFSHFHMDHVAGFDSFFRCTFNRSAKANHVYGPPGTARIMQHRFQGFLWNLYEEMSGTWYVHDVDEGTIQDYRFELSQAFREAHDEGARDMGDGISSGEGYRVEALTMDHRTPSLAYIIREKPKVNIDTKKLASAGFRPGPWMRDLKDASLESDGILIDGVAHPVEKLRSELLVETEGESLAYLTDFLLDQSAMDRLTDALRGCRTVVCEAQYRDSDLELARKNFHMTTVLSATLAEKSGVHELLLFHLSDRYDRETWIDMLREAREIFPNTRYPGSWHLDDVKDST